MGWTIEELTAVLKRNPHITSGGKTPVVEHRHADALPKPDEGKEIHDGLILIRLTSRRVRALDPDNVCEKHLIDCCRWAGLIPDDTPDKISIEVRQEKVHRYKDEEIIVNITYRRDETPNKVLDA